MRQLWYILILIFVVLLSSCRTQYIPVETIKTEYRTRDSIQHDSIFQSDSVYLMIKGDTVYMYKYKYLYKYKYINKTDTLLKADSIQIPFPVEKKLSRWQQFKVDFGGTAMLVIVIGTFLILGWGVRKLKIN